MRSVDISEPTLTGCLRTDVTLPHPDAIPSNQPCWLPGMSKSSFLLSQILLASRGPLKLSMPWKGRDIHCSPASQNHLAEFKKTNLLPPDIVSLYWYSRQHLAIYID